MIEPGFDAIPGKWQKKWDAEKVFEANPDYSKEKFFFTVPYPYISGSLHIGHARVAIEADVFSRFQRMNGRNVLYPMAFHISGTPVLGISLAIKNRDLEKIELYTAYVRNYVSDEKKVKEIVASFEEPQKIVDFFIPKMVSEFKTLGLSVDWRRSYTSGDLEHQALVEWQFLDYKDKGYLVQGKYPLLFSLSLQNAVGEDDIQDGDIDPVSIQEFTAIKFKFEDGFLLAATLRPETMYGQTNMWVNPGIDYVKVRAGNETWFVSQPCAEKLGYQDKKIEVIKKVPGTYFIGKKCFAPFVEKDVIILPSVHCDPEIGTGIVTSVPGDAPFDYISLKELQDSKAECEKYGLSWDEIKKIKLIPIIKSKGYADFPAVEICRKMKITSLSQKDKLVEATQEIYKAGFHTGIMASICGPYAGKPVAQAKEAMKKALLDARRAIVFYEASRPAKSRDGGNVIVAIIDKQWFLDFNSKGWKEKARNCLEGVELWPEKYRKQFLDVFDWLDKRPCARKRGLGTKLPFDHDWVIESLSDSTIYMALYPIIHLIRKNKLAKEQLNSDFFNYVMNSRGDLKQVSKSTKVPEKALLELNKEWNYWYPFDQRHTFTAHLSNHLSFMIFAHAVIFDRKHWPKRISFHGMVVSGGEKMSKSKGNVISLLDVNKEFGPDSLRAFICNSTSVESTFNWESSQVASMKKHLFELFELVKSIELDKKDSNDYQKYSSFVSKTERAVRDATKAIGKMDLRDYSKIVLHDMLANYKKVKNSANASGLSSINGYLGSKWVRLLCPLVPHLAEELWSLGKNKGFASLAKWPEADEKAIDLKTEKIEEVVSNLRLDIIRVRELAKLKKVSKVKVFVAPEWKWAALEIVKKACRETPDFKAAITALMANEGMKKHAADLPTLAKAMISRYGELSELEKFDELSVLNESRKTLEKEFGAMEIIKAEDAKEPKSKNALPGKPAILLE